MGFIGFRGFRGCRGFILGFRRGVSVFEVRRSTGWCSPVAFCFQGLQTFGLP